jgi:methylated-DNA-[protein]-cysteine S-methyltransferase
MTTIYLRMATPLGAMLLTSNGAALTGAYFAGQKYDVSPQAGWQEDEALDVLAAARAQLSEYFAGERTTFDLPLAPSGTSFQRTVWKALLAIPCGATCSYGAIARAAGEPAAVRAAGAAVGRNPISVIVPCHRVVGADGSLTGYAGGLERKRRLLALEAGRGPLFAALQERGAHAARS